jgi:small subunit ribosomal protein S1
MNENDPPETPDSGAPETPENGDSFAELLEAYGTGMRDDLQVGDAVTGKIIGIGKDTVYVDTGTKVDASVDLAELLDPSGEMPYAVGDEIELYVVGVDESQIRLSRAISGAGGMAMLREARERRIPVDGKVSQTCKGGYRVRVLQRTAFCPASQMDVRPSERPEDHVGQEYRFLVTQIDDRGRNIVLSRRKLLEAEIAETRKALLAELSEGDVREGRVVKLMPYGAFVEIGPGVEGMVHISELSWRRVGKPEDVCRPGDTMPVKILKIDQGGKRISLSAKQVEANPWDTVAERFGPGQTVSGTVTRLAGFGAFVEIAPGLEGLVHLSEMSYVRRVNRPEEVVIPGQTVSVVVKEVDPAARRIGLSLREAEGDPWEEVDTEFPPGRKVDGTVERREKFGLFVSLRPGVTGLVPRSKFSDSADPQALERLRPGDPLSVVVESVNRKDRRISLSPGDASATADWKAHAESRTGDGLNPLAEQLRRAMARKRDEG